MHFLLKEIPPNKYHKNILEHTLYGGHLIICMAEVQVHTISYIKVYVARFRNLTICPIFVRSLSFCSCVNVWKAMIWKRKAKEKQTVGMRSRRKPVKPGDRGQLSQIHITKRSYKSSRGGVSVDPEKINPSLTIQGHQHGTHGGPSLSNNNKQQGQNLHPSFKGRYSTSYMEEHNLSI